MRKISTLLMLFCAFVGTAWAGPTDLPEITTDLNNPIYYTIYNTRSQEPGGLMYYAGDNVGLKDGCTSLTLEDKYKFYFTGSHDEMYIHNAAANGKKLASVNSWTEAGIAWTVSAPTANGLAFGPKGQSGNVYWNDKNFATGSDVSDFTVWGAKDGGSIFIAEKADKCVFPEAGKLYVIEAPLFFNKQGVNKGLLVNADGSLGWNTIDLTNKNCYWQIEVSEGTVALKNLGTGKYVNGTNMADAAPSGKINALGSNQFNIVINGTTLHANGHNGGANPSGNIVNYGGAIGSASAWAFVEKADPDAVQEVTVNYNFTYGGEVKYTQSTATLVGEEYPAITVAHPYGVSATKPAGTIAAGDVVDGKVTKEIVLSVNLPFVPAADYASINNWYYLKFDSSNQYYLHHDVGQDHIDLNSKSVDAGNKDIYSWAFVGNPFDGYQIVNKGAGEGYILSSSTTMTGTTGADTWPVMTATPVPGGNNTYWIPTASTHATNGFFLAQKDYEANRLNNRGKLAYWTGGAGTGSTFTVEERDLSGATELQAVIDQVEAFVEAGVAASTTVGYITTESANNVATALAAAKEAVATKTGCSEAQVALQAAVATVETIQPEEGKFYMIVSSCTKDHRAGQEVYVNNDGSMHFANANDYGYALGSAMSRVWQFVPAANGKFYLKNVERGVFMQSVGTASETDGAKAKAVTISNMGKENRVSLRPDGQSQMHAQDTDSKIVGWNENNPEDGSAWVITEVSIEELAHTVTVGEAGWATLVLGYNATIPAGVTAYAVTDTEGWANLADVAGVIPANEAVLIKANAGNYDFKFTETEATVATNLLKGTVFDTNVAEEAYVLGNIDGVGFYTATFNVNTDTSNDIVEGEGEDAVTTPVNDAFKNNAFKAYLPKTGTSATLRFNFGGTTAIESVLNNGIDANAAIYDLSGRRVEKAVKGIYIQNGKKIIVK